MPHCLSSVLVLEGFLVLEAEQLDTKFHAGSSAAQRKLGAAMRMLCASVPLSHAAICEAVHIAPSTLSGYLSARTVAPKDLIERLCEMAEEAAASSDEPVPVAARAEMLRLHAAACVRHCGCCAVGFPVEKAGREIPVVAPGAQTGRLPQPAARAAWIVRARWRRARQASSTGAAELPVRRQAQTAGTGTLLDGDRHPVAERLSAAGVRELAGHFGTGRAEDARTLIHHVGASAPVDGVPEFVAACREAGLHGAADAVLHYAARRGPSVVLTLAALLAAERRFDDAAVLLAGHLAARPDGGGAAPSVFRA